MSTLGDDRRPVPGDESESFPDWPDLARSLRSGDADAARLIFSRFAGRLIGLAQSRMTPVLRQKLDPEDVTQSVFRTFFRRHKLGEFELLSWDNLWTLLTIITIRKCQSWSEYYSAGVRDVRREQPTECGLVGHGGTLDWNLLDREPTADEVAISSEAISRLLEGLSPRDRNIIECRLNGDTFEQISSRLGVSERTAERVLRRVRQRIAESPD